MENENYAQALARASSSDSGVVLLLGLTGDGKSSIANTIMGGELYAEGKSLHSETSQCQVEIGTWFGLNRGLGVTVIDTPGFLDSDRRDALFLYGLVDFMRHFPRGKLRMVIVTLSLAEVRAKGTYKDMMETIELLLGRSAWRNVVFVTTQSNRIVEQFANRQMQEWKQWLRDNVPMPDNKEANHCNFVYDDPHSLDPLQAMFRSFAPFTPEVSQKIDLYLSSNPSASVMEIIQSVEATQQLRDRYVRELQLVCQQNEELLAQRTELAANNERMHASLEKFQGEVNDLHSRLESLQNLPPPTPVTTEIHHPPEGGGGSGGLVVGILHEVVPLATAIVSASECVIA